MAARSGANGSTDPDWPGNTIPGRPSVMEDKR